MLTLQETRHAASTVRNITTLSIDLLKSYGASVEILGSQRFQLMYSKVMGVEILGHPVEDTFTLTNILVLTFLLCFRVSLDFSLKRNPSVLRILITLFEEIIFLICRF